ncbi:DUF6670 family protein [Gordonia hydrophobica]|uniref:DUF6670 family protein n=1 Tax=Gordonia hydrophobica TaxID=40516 RepID=A0ABZ2TWF2_9ACTN|nr:DUF6670 family protein [Gordonia hydrophobica]MBM7365775.1 hypothetical protein [Gordonia hydrophobica]
MSSDLHKGLLTRGRVVDRLAPILVRARPLLDSRRSASVRPFDDSAIMRPEVDSTLWGWTHYGFFIPDLPEPFRYVNTMTLIGATGTRIFDNGVIAAQDARKNATVFGSTAYGNHHHYRAYDAERDCDFAVDGSRLRWGDDLSIECAHPEYRVSGRYESFSIDLTLQATDQVSYFVRTPIYQHFSVLAPYRGTVTSGGESVAVEGLGTVEYARSVSPQVFRSTAIGPGLRLPVDFFTYQVVPLNSTTQLLLTDVRANGTTACRLAQIRRSTGGPAEIAEDVQFQVVEYQPELLADTAGVPMRVPAVMRWDVGGRGHLDCVVDAPMRTGHGRGFSSAYSFTGEWDGEKVAGSAYLEWIDCEG